MEDVIDNALHSMKVEVQGEIDGANDSLKKSLSTVENEIALLRKTQIEHETNVKDVRGSISKNFEE